MMCRLANAVSIVRGRPEDIFVRHLLRESSTNDKYTDRYTDRQADRQTAAVFVSVLLWIEFVQVGKTLG